MLVPGFLRNPVSPSLPVKLLARAERGIFTSSGHRSLRLHLLTLSPLILFSSHFPLFYYSPNSLGSSLVWRLPVSTIPSPMHSSKLRFFSLKCCLEESLFVLPDLSSSCFLSTWSTDVRHARLCAGRRVSGRPLC